MEFQPCHQSALLLAGAVPLPAPFPATGTVSIVLIPDDGEPDVLVKILQVVSARRIITRFVRPADIRAIQAQPAGSPPSGPESWPIRGIRGLRAEIASREKALRAEYTAKGVLGEAPWYAAAIVHVAESAPVLHRDEVGVTAAVSAEEVAFSEGQTCCCCHKPEPWPEPPVWGEGGCCHKVDRHTQF